MKTDRSRSGLVLDKDPWVLCESLRHGAFDFGEGQARGRREPGQLDSPVHQLFGAPGRRLARSWGSGRDHGHNMSQVAYTGSTASFGAAITSKTRPQQTGSAVSKDSGGDREALDGS